MAKTGIGWWDNAVESVYNMYNDFKKNLPDNNAQTSNNETKVQTQSAAPKAASSKLDPKIRWEYERPSMIWALKTAT